MKTRKYYATVVFCVFFSLLGLEACQDQGTHFSFENTVPGAFSTAVEADFDGLLQRYVDSHHLVRYDDWHRNSSDLAKLKTVLDAIAKADDTSMSADERKAFYINAYNAMTLDLILSHYDETMGGAQSPIPGNRSIRNISNFDTKVWDQFQWIVAGKNRTLNEIENKVLRPTGDARIHFAIVCASMGCPPLHPRTFTASTLNGTLDSLADAFVNSGHNTLFDQSRGKLRTSHILDWFKQDFVKTFGSVQAFFEKYVRVIPTQEIHGLKIEFDSYDWTLNQSRPERGPIPTPPPGGSGTENEVPNPEASPFPAPAPLPSPSPGGSGTERDFS